MNSIVSRFRALLASLLIWSRAPLALGKVTIKTPPIPESEVVRYLQNDVQQWHDRCRQLEQENARLREYIREMETELLL